VGHPALGYRAHAGDFPGFADLVCLRRVPGG
jgi:hypothetical protein